MCGAEMDESQRSQESGSVRKKVGIMGGTFDPIHNAHLALGECARIQLKLDEVWFMPAKDPYFKKKKNVTPARFRAEMTSLAVFGREGFEMSDFELLRDGETYTAETLEKLNELYPDIHFYFIVGSDSMYQIETWWRPETIMKLATLVVAEREYPERQRSFMDQVAYLSEKFGADIRVLDFEESDISSTMIREMAARGEDISGLVPEAVALYIGKHGLYK
ncbi:nicotinate/nicotinamide nucleotide adenylyltransferase [Lachnospiraceae bacterium JC7]|nr:nicotinate/nicotinamide nucleotide adenylyltransferase [Lachnospiraceae bacterium JC7]